MKQKKLTDLISQHVHTTPPFQSSAYISILSPSVGKEITPRRAIWISKPRCAACAPSYTVTNPPSRSLISINCTSRASAPRPLREGLPLSWSKSCESLFLLIKKVAPDFRPSNGEVLSSVLMLDESELWGGGGFLFAILSLVL